MKKYIFICCLMLSPLLRAQSVDAIGLTLEEAIEYAIDSSYTTINARRDVAKAIKQKWETTATGLPQINAEANYTNQLRQPKNFIPAQFFDENAEPGTFVPVVFSTEQQADVTATLTQLIFDGSYLVGLQAAKAFLQYSKNFEEKAKLEVRKGVINAYGSVLVARQSYDIIQRNKETLDKNLSETELIFENGLTEEENVEQLRLTQLQLDSQLNNAKRMLELAEQMFNLSIGLPIEQDVVFLDALSNLAENNIDPSLVGTALNIEENVDYKIAFNLTEQRTLEWKLERSKALPSLGAFINYGTQANRNDFNFFDSDLPWFAFSIAGAKLTIPIFSSLGRSARTQRARIALDQAETQFTETQQRIQLELEQAQSNYQFAIENYANLKENLSLAERIEQKNQVKFTEGIATSFDLRQAQTQLYASQQEYLQSMLSVITAKSELETVLNLPNYSSTSSN